jgi:NAD(P)-dependent dehydrogenase (short-subunit alcohol dehydrogenase family)
VKDLRDRVAVITGAASGIGRSMASRFAAEGMKLVLADIESQPLLEAEQELKKQGVSVLAITTDVSKAESVEALRQKAVETFGFVHILCNNAGVNAPVGPVWERTTLDWKWVLGVNLWGVVHGIRTFLPGMIESGLQGHIVNTASRDGFLAGPLLGVYSASKYAVVSLSESLYFELAMMRSQIGVSLLCPGAVKTRVRWSERNRPGELDNGYNRAKTTVCEVDELEQGILPSQVADRVVEGIRSNQFYIFVTTPQDMAHIRTRSEWILAQRNPVFLESREERLKRIRLNSRNSSGNPNLSNPSTRQTAGDF